MGSKKKSARMAQRRSFEQGLGDELGGVFAREDARRAQQEEQRYVSEADAKDAIRSCERHGSRDLHCYRCPYCGGWHLTHKAAKK